MSAGIRGVSLEVDPPSVRRGQPVTFICSYELDGTPLYSVKFYRGVYEFYRFSPSELPTSKVFPFPGINVDVSDNSPRSPQINIRFDAPVRLQSDCTPLHDARAPDPAATPERTRLESQKSCTYLYYFCTATLFYLFSEHFRLHFTWQRHLHRRLHAYKFHIPSAMSFCENVPRRMPSN